MHRTMWCTESTLHTDKTQIIHLNWWSETGSYNAMNIFNDSQTNLQQFSNIIIKLDMCAQNFVKHWLNPPDKITQIGSFRQLKGNCHFQCTELILSFRNMTVPVSD